MKRLFPLRIIKDFIGSNDRISIISNSGLPYRFPSHWEKVLDSFDVIVGIPDMHMFIYSSNLDNFKYGAESMLHFIEHLKRVKQDLARDGKRVGIFQLGDLYELQFPYPNRSYRPSGSDIRRSHSIYNSIIHGLNELDCQLIYGNHDYKHRIKDGFKLIASDGAVHIEHGFRGDKFYHFSNPHSGERFWELSMKVFKYLRVTEDKLNRYLKKHGYIEDEQHAAYGVRSGEVERSYLPHPKYYPKHIYRYYEKQARELGNRICLIAHTHHPYLNDSFLDGEGLFLDAGCWTDGRADFAVITNEEAAICNYRRNRAIRSIKTLHPVRQYSAQIERFNNVAFEAL